MIKPEEYLKLIEEIRNTDKKSLNEFIVKIIEPLRKTNENFIEILYKDIYYLIKDIDKENENDLIIENGELLVESGELKLTGYQSRLHNLSVWLHLEVCEKLMKENPLTFVDKIQEFENLYLKNPNYTPEYKSKLDKIKKSLKKERKLNLGENENFWDKILDLDNYELNPNINGVGINLKEIFNKFKQP